MDVVSAPGAPPADVLGFFRLLADETRLATVRMLTVSDLRAGEIVERLQAPANAVSYHLKQLRSLGLLRDRRSSADARDIYYSIDLTRLHALYASAGAVLHPGMLGTQEPGELQPVIKAPLRILFLCTHNKARSQMAEALARFLAGNQVEVFSAGDQPGQIHPLTVEALEEIGLDTVRMYSKSVVQFRDQQFDYIITTCDTTREICPTFPGDPTPVHWSLADPTTVGGGEAAQRIAFRALRQELLTRIRYLLTLPHPRTGERLKLRPALQGAQV